MSVLTFFSALISPVTKVVTKVNDNKTKLKEKNIQRMMNAEDKNAEWESIQAENGSTSWKDEFWTIVLSIPLMLCFFPSMVQYVTAGFEALQGMPDFYQYWLGAAILTSFGIRIIK